MSRHRNVRNLREEDYEDYDDDDYEEDFYQEDYREHGKFARFAPYPRRTKRPGRIREVKHSNPKPVEIVLKPTLNDTTFSLKSLSSGFNLKSLASSQPKVMFDLKSLSSALPTKQLDLKSLGKVTIPSSFAKVNPETLMDPQGSLKASHFSSLLSKASPDPKHPPLDLLMRIGDHDSFGFNSPSPDDIVLSARGKAKQKPIRKLE